MHFYEVRPRKDHRGVDLISDALPFGRLWYGEPNAVANAIGYAKHRSRSHGAVIRVYDETGNAIDARARGRFQRAMSCLRRFTTSTQRGVVYNIRTTEVLCSLAGGRHILVPTTMVSGVLRSCVPW
jgi:hypothetical protein